MIDGTCVGPGIEDPEVAALELAGRDDDEATLEVITADDEPTLLDRAGEEVGSNEATELLGTAVDDSNVALEDVRGIELSVTVGCELDSENDEDSDREDEEIGIVELITI